MVGSGHFCRMVFKKGGRASSNVRSTAVTALVMECWEENLSPVQIQSFKQKVLECQIAQEKVKEAHRLAELGLAIVTVMDDPRKPIPPPTLQQLQAKTGSTYGNAPNSQPTKEPPRSTSPDIIFIGESPPTPRVPPSPTITPPTPTQKLQYRFTSTNHTAAVPRQLVKTLHMPDGQVHRFPAYPTLARHPNTTTVPVQNVNPNVTPVHGTYGLGVKRPLPQQPQQQMEDTSPKRKRVETENEVNWVPLDEYYYGKSEGDLSYAEEKNEFRFKVHMNNVNVLMCRICERDHQSRHALLTHMRVNHNACEMPYICQLCKFRSSMYSDVVDHFKKKHDSSQHILCLYCLKVFVVKFVSQGWGQTQTYYGHLLKHQSKSGSKKCNSCRLTFVNPADCKNHKKKDHVANQKGIGSCSGAFEQDLMIKMPEARKQAVKSLNAPAVSKVLDFGGTKFPYAVNFNTCVECKTVMGTPDHFRKHIECSMCRFATSCSIAYANHMMGFHSGQMTSLNLNIPWERPMKEPMHCLCGFASRYGNKIANHLVYCTKRSCYNKKPTQVIREVEEEEQDPRHKPGASLLDVLGLVKKKNITTKERTSTDTGEILLSCYVTMVTIHKSHWCVVLFPR
uniref:Pogo transposable element with ZNF domain n=1 Tax=Magallana gigas TaxID=29159 RepID=K1R6V0_MAGGI